MTIFIRELILTAGRTIVFIGGLISLLLSIGYLFAPSLLSSISKPVNQLFSADEWLLVNRILVGICFAIVTIVLFSVLIFVK